MWYRTGSISVTNGSAAVTGVGTAWASPAVKAGYALMGPDGALYEIAAVSSAEALTLATPYGGPNAAGAAYVVVPTQSLNVELHAALQAHVQAVTDIDVWFAEQGAAFDQLAAEKATAADSATAAMIAAKTAEADAFLAGFDLSAIFQQRDITPVDVFVYDTSRDSDGGAWRHRCQGKSWYNEPLSTAIRGSRREFPAIAVLVVTADSVTIYDGDDPALPMWMIADVFDEQNSAPFAITGLGGQPSAIGPLSALNGQIFFCGTGGYSSQGLLRWDFVADCFGNHAPSPAHSGWTSGAISERNELCPFVAELPVISVARVRDVAATIRPRASVAAATGLPSPTIAVGTGGGLSIITDSGAVFDSAKNAAVSAVTIDAIGHIRAAYADGEVITYDPDEITADGFTGTTLSAASTPALLGATTKLARHASGSARGLTFLHGSMVAYAAADYATGWMVGDIKGCWLSDTSTGDLLGGEQVTNGGFDVDLSGWAETGTSGVVTWDASGAALIGDGDGVTSTIFTQTVATVPGRSYVFSADIIGSGAGVRVYIGSVAMGNGIYYDSAVTSTFTAVSNSTTIKFFRYRTQTGAIKLNNVSVKPAAADRSVNNNGLIVNGTISREPVAPGAELMAFGGFSTTDFFEQAYNSALDFGTGDFCYMGWVRFTSGGSTRGIFARASDASHGVTLAKLTASGAECLRLWINSAWFDTTKSIADGAWHHIAIVRESGVVTIYLDGVANASREVTGDISSPVNAESLMLGKTGSSGPPDNLMLALWRISATAPTPAQIAKIYYDEKALFRENAACTLYGSSGAVAALAHDAGTGLLHAGTTAGRSVFDGLSRVSNTTTPVSAAISAAAGLIVEG